MCVRNSTEFHNVAHIHMKCQCTQTRLTYLVFFLHQVCQIHINNPRLYIAPKACPIHTYIYIHVYICAYVYVYFDGRRPFNQHW